MLLASYGDPLALDALRNVAGSDSDPGTRRAAAYALGVIGGEDNVDTLVEVVNFEAPPLPPAAANPQPAGPGGLNRPNAQEVVQAVDRQLRCQALTSLAIIGGPKAIDAIALAMDHPQEAVGSHAMALLAELGDPRAFERVVKSLSDQNYCVAMDAVWACEFYDDPKLVGPLIGLAGNARDEKITVIEHLLGGTSYSSHPVNTGPELRMAAMGAIVRKWPKQASGVLVERLKDSDPAVVVQAAEYLGAAGDASSPVVAGLTAVLKGATNRNARYRAGTQLCRLRVKDAFRPCMDLLQTGKDTALVKAMAPLAAESFMDLLEAELTNPQGRHAAALMVLAQIGKPQPDLADLVMSFMDDKDAIVRTSAIGAAGGIKHADAVEMLQVLLEEGQDMVQPAATALGEIGDPSAVPALLAALQRNEANSQVTADIAKALGQIGDKRAMGPLMQLARGNMAVAEGLALLGDKQALPALSHLMYGSTYYRPAPLEVAKAIFSLQREASVDALGKVLRVNTSSNEPWRVEAVEMLGRVSSPEAIAYVHLAMRDGNRDVRLAARKALANIKTSSATKPASGATSAPASVPSGRS